MDNKKKSVLNILTSILLKVITICFGIIIPKLFINHYGSSVYGLHSSITQVFTYIALLEGGIGAATLQSLYGPIKKKDSQTVNSYISATSYYYNKVGLFYFIVLSLVSVGYALFVKVEGLSFAFIIIYVLVSGAVTGVNFFFQAKLCLVISADGKEYISSSLQIFSYTLISVIKIVLIPKVNIVLLQSLCLAAHLLITLLYFIVYKKRYPWLSFKTAPDFKCLEQKNSVLIHKISAIIFQNVDIILLTLFFRADLWIVSVYAIYKMVVNMVVSFVTTISASVNFAFGQAFNSEEEPRPRYLKLIDVFDVYYSSLAFALFSVMFLLMNPFLEIYTANLDVNYVYSLLPFLYILIEFLTVGREAMIKTIEVAGHFKKTQFRALAETIINVVLCVTLICVLRHFYGPIGGIYGALLGTIGALLYRTFDVIIYSNKFILKRKPFKSLLIMLINLCTFLVIFVVFRFIHIDTSSYLKLFLHALWITPVSLLLFFFTQSIFNRNEFILFKTLVLSFFFKKHK